MNDPKSALLEIALRAVQQHLERDEYTEAGDVVMQALARAEQMTEPDLRATFRDTMDSLDMAELAVQQEQRIAELEKQLAAPASEPVAVVDSGDDGLFVEILYGDNGSPLRFGDKLYAAPQGATQ